MFGEAEIAPPHGVDMREIPKTQIAVMCGKIDGIRIDLHAQPISKRGRHLLAHFQAHDSRESPGLQLVTHLLDDSAGTIRERSHELGRRLAVRSAGDTVIVDTLGLWSWVQQIDVVRDNLLQRRKTTTADYAVRTVQTPKPRTPLGTLGAMAS